eukprot:CAMPEP_0201909282 /NCGR_PEP_ID=MMETSP0903-20130614/1105_1 /ASSEMBLY_ACC=CAM_ASM_000552 /TAXON_ID=420261 /ORGANISM="Thalassiosira antarctica, Strain CCMP982" /LENGTH=47 /DNA_ID= /DNA_START= /DNA_END= /DNA_ORIENTATION=
MATPRKRKLDNIQYSSPRDIAASSAPAKEKNVAMRISMMWVMRQVLR